jgi:hypothetical protein
VVEKVAGGFYFEGDEAMHCVKILLPLLLLGMMSSHLADAAVRDRIAQRRAAAARAPLAPPAAAANPTEPHEMSQPGPTWSMTPELYPQWYGGFHGRMLQNYGYPAGDIGLRGQAW